MSIDGLGWVQLLNGTRVRGTAYVYEGSAKTTAHVHKTAEARGATGNTTQSDAWDSVVSTWAATFGRLHTHPG